MKIDGRQIASEIYKDLKNRVEELKKIGVTSHLAVFLIGDDPASKTYVNQKQKWGKYIGAQITILHYSKTATTEEIIKKIHDLNANPNIHAILIQRPLPPQIDIKKIELSVNPQKDIDGFHPDSPYTMPLPLAVLKILEKIYIKEEERKRGVTEVGHSEQSERARLRVAEGEKTGEDRAKQEPERLNWLKSKKIVILGKGATGGGPILKYFQKLGAPLIQIDSKTPNPDEILKKADIIISAVGKPDIITPEKIKKDAILIGVGIFRGEDEKLHGDYDEKQIKNIANFYTPTPGGVGPVNVAMLLKNLLAATKKQTNYLN